MDTDSLRAILAKRTPGEWLLDMDRPHSVIVADGGFVCGVVRNASPNDARAIVAAVNAIGPLLERVERTEEILGVALSSPSSELTSMTLLTQRCCGEITIHGFYQQVEWERIDEYRVRPKGAKCQKCGKEWTAQFISRTENAITPIEAENKRLLEQFRAVCESRQDIVKKLAAANARVAELETAAAGREGRGRNGL